MGLYNIDLSKNKSEIRMAEPNETPLGIANKRESLEFKVKISMFRFKFELYGYALNFCIKWNISFKRINREEIWSIWIPSKGNHYIDDKGNEKVF